MGEIIHRMPVISKDEKFSKKKNEERWRSKN